MIPEPLSVAARTGDLTVRSGMAITLAGMIREQDRAEASWIASYLSDLLRRTAGLNIAFLPQEKGAAPSPGITLMLSPEQSSELSVQAKESYDLDVSPGGIVIRARTTAGLFYGAVTLWQLLTQTPDCRGPVTLNAVHIHDEPRFAWRGFMLDSARHFQSAQFVEQIIDWMALHKLNTLHWHLTDDQGWRIEIKKYPRLIEIGAWRVEAGHANQTDIDPATGKPRLYGGYYTQDQIREIVAYASRRNITIVPEIEMPGHESASIAAYPELGSTATPPLAPSNTYGVHLNLYNVDDSTFTFLDNVLTEVMALFPSEYIHVGGDEAVKDQWKSNPAIQAKMHQQGITNEDALQSYFIQRVEKFLNAHQRRLIGWDEILEGGLAQNATVMSWRGVEGGITAAKAGHDAVLSPARPLYLNYRQSDAPDEPAGRAPLNTLKDVYTFEPIPPNQLTPEQSAHIIGVQANLWTEYVRSDPQIEHMLFPRMAALAEVGWSSPSQLSWPDFLTRLVPQFSRYAALGIHPADSVFEVRVSKQLEASHDNVNVSLSNQAEFGKIRFTTDGAPVTSESPVYTEAVTLPLPSVLRAGTFYNGSLVTPAIDETLNSLTVRRRNSRELQLCSEDPALEIEDDAPLNGKHAVFLVNYFNPCWIYKDADLSGIASIEAGIGQLPFNFAMGDSQPPRVRKPSTPYGELEVFDSSCKGKPIAVLPLEPATHSDAVTKLAASLPAMSGTHDLCFTFTRPTLDPMWVIDWVQLVPKSTAASSLMPRQPADSGN
ncbi:MAG: family 20 glycosylhydrolase [Silvibacterium sp.]